MMALLRAQELIGRFVARTLSIAMGGLVWSAQIAAPISTAACQCAERGTAIVLDEATVAREPIIAVAGEACTPQNVVCQHRDNADRCDVYWISPDREGQCLISATFADGSGVEHTILFDEDNEYPCRGNVRPQRDGVVRIETR